MTVTSAFGYHTTIRDLADGMLELDGGVMNLKFCGQHLPDFAQDALTGGGRNIGDADVAGKSGRGRTDAPTVRIVHMVPPADLADCRRNLLQPHSAGSAFQ